MLASLKEMFAELFAPDAAAVFAGADSLRRTTLDVRAVTVRNLTYVDFLLPGVLSMSIMQLGIFGVAFAFVTLKRAV